MLRSSLLAVVGSEFIFELCLSSVSLGNFNLPKNITLLCILTKESCQTKSTEFLKSLMRTVCCVWRKRVNVFLRMLPEI